MWRLWITETEREQKEIQPNGMGCKEAKVYVNMEGQCPRWRNAE